MRKVGILGMAPTTLHEAPYADPSWELWSLPWSVVRRSDRFFDPHKNWDTQGYYTCGPERKTITSWLSDLGGPLYMDKVEPDIPNSVAIPWDEIKGITGRPTNGTDEPYIESTIGVMLAVACLELEAGDKLGLWGVDLDTDGEYAYQRPNAEFFLGYLKGKGVSLFIPKKSALLSTCYPEFGRYA